MRFKILKIEASQAVKNQFEPPFRWMAHHVKEIYMEMLPDVVINGSQLIEIDCGPQGDEEIFDNILGSTNHFVEDFDFKKYYALSSFDRDVFLLNEITRVLSLIAERAKNNDAVDIIRATADKVIESNFSISIPVKKLCKKSRDGMYKVDVYRVLNSEVGEAWRCVIATKSPIEERNVWMTKIPDHLDRTDFYKKSELDNGIFRVFNQLSRQVFEFAVFDSNRPA